MSYFEKEFKSELDEYIGKKPLVTKQDRDTFWNHANQQKQSARNWIPKSLTAMLLLGVGIFLFFQLQGRFLDNRTSLDEVTENYPSEVKEKIILFPEDIQDILVLPKTSDFSSEPGKIEMSIESYPEMNDPTSDQISVIEFLFDNINPRWTIHYSIYPNGASNQTSKDEETITLTNGLQADLLEDGPMFRIQWKDAGTFYEVMIVNTNGTYEKESAINLVNSMYK
ncbi:hypothetical protein [Radiobacillus deserti]|uniref:DUF4367 domain-containing protein n=1 Tax=Radiobacillus deserti TaxID=2594883 RepID=A0A516KDW8_9BACI|nr:hypothetical protein [Radiobacillus deserti]QDP39506.1 hypothetical protein FN924_04535 [Radiobacillus deserti]